MGCLKLEHREFSNSLRVVHNDLKISVKSCAGAYRYGFNGMEKDNEHTQGKYDFGARIYDSRIGRWLSVDPVYHHNQSQYCGIDNNPIRYIDPTGMDVVNGDQKKADGFEKGFNAFVENFEKFKKENKIDNNTRRKDFLKSGGSKETWKKYKRMKKDVKKGGKKLKALKQRAAITQGIIDRWKKSSPNLFKQVDEQDVDFLLYSKSDPSLEDGSFGSTTPRFKGTKENPIKPDYMEVMINDKVNLFSGDPGADGGQFALNHEAGHFLYIVKFHSEYIKFYFKSKEDGTYRAGGHGKNDESGKVAEKLGRVQDVPPGGYEIKIAGN